MKQMRNNKQYEIESQETKDRQGPNHGHVDKEVGADPLKYGKAVKDFKQRNDIVKFVF